jgi:uncharacterized protein (DUF924 family)
MSPDEVLDFWFPPGLDRDEPTHRAQVMRWFRGGTDDDIRARFGPTLDAAIRGELDGWAATPRGRLALILVLDQFSRSLFRDSARAFAQDARAQQLTLEGLDRGDDRELAPWERIFFVLPLGHSEDLALQERSVAYAEALIDEAPPALRGIYEMSARQAAAHRDVIRRFGRHPHRNAVLGRTSTPDEQAYLAAGDFPHQRRV